MTLSKQRFAGLRFVAVSSSLFSQILKHYYIPVPEKAKVLWLLLLWLGIQSASQAQGLCNQGEKPGGFTVNGVPGTATVTGCAPFEVTVINTVAGADPIGYDFDYKGQAQPDLPTNIKKFSYTKPGRYRILQGGSSSAGSITLCREVIVKERRPPKARLVSCSGGKVKLIIEKDSVSTQYDQFVVSWNDSSGPEYVDSKGSLEATHTYSGSGSRQVQVQGLYLSGSCTGGNPVSLTVQLNQVQLSNVTIKSLDARADGTVALSIEGLEGITSQVMVKTGTGAYIPSNTSSNKGGAQTLTLATLDPKQMHCIMLRSPDACGDSTDSNELCTVVLSGKAENERNVVTWSKYPAGADFSGYQLFRDGVSIKSFTDNQQVSYVDRDMKCGVTYRYQLKATTAKASSQSPPVEVVAGSDAKPDPIDQASVSVEPDGRVSLVGYPPVPGDTTAYTMIFERSEGGPNGKFQEVGRTKNTNRYNDPTARTSEQSYCYRISYEDACGNRSEPSAPICTIFLKKSGSSIQWTPDVPFSAAVGEYFVIKSNSGGVLSEIGVGINVTYDPQLDDTDPQEFKYLIKAPSQSGNFLSFSNVLLIRREASLFMPDAFTPNGDGINDTFHPSGTLFDNFQMIIFNRWGQSVYETTDAIRGWDGIVGGERAPQGQYIYKVSITDSTGKEFVKTGSVLLML